MKKLLLTPALLLALSSANAQLALENFNGASMPAGWTMINDANKPHASVWTAAIVSGLTANAYMKFTIGTGNDAMLSVAIFDPSAAADRWLITPDFAVTGPDMMISWKELEVATSNSGVINNVEVWVSTTGGGTKASFTTKLGSKNVVTGTERKFMLPLGAFAGQNVKVAFRSTAKDAGAFYIDDIQTENVPQKNDGENTAINFPSIISSTGSTPVTFNVTNKGTSVITTVQGSYVVDAGTPVTQTFTGLNIYPGDVAALSFTTGASAAAGAHTLTTTILQVNGAADDVATNNIVTKNFVAATKSVNRSGLMEEFTSSTCAPCASFNATFDPLIISLKANEPATRFNIVKYQMNWPSPGTDVCYNADGATRRGYYGVTGIPDHYTNGTRGGDGDNAEINDSKTAPAFMDISGTYVVKGDSIISDVTVTPYFTATGTFKLHMAATEYHYTNPGATTSQKEYYHVMRTMLNAGAGTTISSFTSGTAQKFHWAAKYTKGTPVQGSNTFWASPFGGNLVVFVQDESDKTVLQSQSVPATWPVSIADVNTVISQTSVYPNPATDHTSIAFKLESSSSVGINVVDAMGRTVYTVAEQQLNAGTQVVEIPTTALSAGIYIIKLNTETGSVSQRFSVVK